MWFLKNSAGEVIYLLPGKEITVGRKQSDILLHDDSSISRLHATLIIEKRKTLTVNPNDHIFTCTLTDKGSKYGTFVTSRNKTIQILGQSCILQNDDVIKFGLQSHIFSVVYTPMITMASSLRVHEINKLQKIVHQMGGLYCDTYSENCTHLTVSGGVLTQKVVWAIASCIPVVTMEYWDAVQQAVVNKTKLPKPDEYAPVPGDNINRERVSYAPNELRKLLFKQKIFVHFTAAQFKEYKRIIHLAGGKSVLYDMEDHNIKDLSAKNIIVLQYTISDITQSTIEIIPGYNAIYEYLKKRNRRMVSENEIALALLHCSIEKFCNPAFCFSNILKRIRSTQMETCDTLVCDTQDELPLQNCHVSKVPTVNSRHFIPETNDFSLGEESEEYKKPRHQPNKSKLPTVKSNHFIPETNDFSLGEESEEYKKPCQQSKKSQVPAVNSQHFIPESNDFSLREESEEYKKPRQQSNKSKVPAVNSQHYIPETNDFSLRKESEEYKKPCQQSKKSQVPAVNSQHFIPETNDFSLGEESEEYKKSRQQSKKSQVPAVNSQHFIPESNDFSLREESEEYKKPCQQSNKSKVPAVNSQHYIPETNDFSLKEESEKYRKPCQQSNKSQVPAVNSQHFIPETNDFSLREESEEHKKPCQQSDKTSSIPKNSYNSHVGGSSLHSQKIGVVIPETQEFDSDHSDDIIEVDAHHNRVTVKNIFAKPGPSDCVSERTGSLSNMSSTNKNEKVAETKIVENDNNKTDVKKFIEPIIIDESDDSWWDDGIWLSDCNNLKNVCSEENAVCARNKDRLSSDNDSERKFKVPVKHEYVFKHRKEKRWISATKHQVILNELHPLEMIVPIKLRDPSEIGKTFKKQEVIIPANRIKFEDLVEASWN